MGEYKGILLFHSETGTEGGYWAMQDERFITPAPEQTSTKHCQKCGTLWTFAGPNARPEPVPQFLYYRPGWTGPEGQNYIGGYFGSDEWLEDGQTKFGDEPDGSINDVYTRTRNAKARECKENGHAWELWEEGPSWSYEGLHVLHDGDHLTVYSPDDKKHVVWEGEIKLKQHALFTEHAGGMWIHADQEGIDRETWAQMFFDGYPCRLVTRDKKRVNR